MKIHLEQKIKFIVVWILTFFFILKAILNRISLKMLSKSCIEIDLYRFFPFSVDDGWNLWSFEFYVWWSSSEAECDMRRWWGIDVCWFLWCLMMEKQHRWRSKIDFWKNPLRNPSFLGEMFGPTVKGRLLYYLWYGKGILV